MKKQLTEKTEYKPNDKVKVTVTHKPVVDDGGHAIEYKRTVSITIDEGYDTEKIQFGSDEDIAKYIETVDFEDPQQSLLDE